MTLESASFDVAHVHLRLGAQTDRFERALVEVEADRLVERIWSRDHTVWQPDPTEVSNRLGWLDIAERMVSEIERIDSFVDGVRRDGFERVVLLGMGGSSLAPEVFARVFGSRDGYPQFDVLDSTASAAVLACAEASDPSTTLYLVSSKSGTTVETISFFRFFYRKLVHLKGPNVGGHFVAIADPGSELVDTGRELGFRAVFENDPDIGGRFSALSFFGLIPAALIGIDLGTLLGSAQAMMRACRRPAADNPGMLLGLAMSECARQGRDKLTVFTDSRLDGLGDWIEQLVAESTGKSGVGILPVVSEPFVESAAYGPDRLFAIIGGRDEGQVPAVSAFGYPAVELSLADAIDLGGQFVLWEMATAVACARLGINAFDQPNVESAKEGAKRMMAAFEREGELPEAHPTPPTGGTIREFVEDAVPPDYVAILAYLTPTNATDRLLQGIRIRIRDATRCAVTVGFGPRYLHSSGQLHKGDGGNGRFIVLTTDAEDSVPIPDSTSSDAGAITFGTLIAAQALGDMEALRDAGRKVLHLHLGADALAELRDLSNAI